MGDLWHMLAVAGVLASPTAAALEMGVVGAHTKARIQSPDMEVVAGTEEPRLMATMATAARVVMAGVLRVKATGIYINMDLMAASQGVRAA